MTLSVERRLGDLVDVTTGQSAPQDTKAFGVAGHPFIRAGSLESLTTGGSEEECEKIEADIATRYRLRLFPANTIIFAKSGMSATLGRVYRLKRPCYLVAHLAALVPTGRVEPVFLERWLAQHPPARLIKDKAYPSIRTSEVEEMAILLPESPAEQRRVSNILDQADSIRRKRREALKLADEFLRSAFLELSGDPIVNPRGWPMKKLGQLGTLDRGKSRHRPRDEPALYGGSHPFIQTGDVANCDGVIRRYSQTYSDFGLSQSRKWPAGTLAITIAANIGKTGILGFDACFPDSVVGFTARPPTTAEFIQFWLNQIQSRLEESAPQAAQKNINLEILRDLSVPFPDEPSMLKFTQLVRRTRELKLRQESMLRESDDLFASIQQRSFSSDSSIA